MPNIQKREITTELQESYLDYAMSVIVARALPDVRDGLKPVQRRILWAMWDMGLKHDSKTMKSARVVGECLGKYHPHGDTAVYDAMVRLAQDFSLRYPLLQGQGNFGSIDGDAAAHQRYTEIRPSRISSELLFDIEKETVDWQPNYDGSRQEPKVLPAKLPNLLLNGTVGIAVGMATNIPPHNLREVADAILHFIAHPKATSEDLLQFIQGPDFPTGGVIFDRKAIAEAYKTGRGPITTRAVAEVNERPGGRNQFDIVISEIPYQVNKSELIVKIAELVTEKKIEGIRDVRDESDKDGLRIVLELKNDAAPQKILNQLFQHTDLQKDFHLNMVALADGLQPQLLSLRDIVHAYVAHRETVVRRRAEFDLRKARERAHILEGLAKALDSIDRVIATIKKSEDREDAKKNLIAQFRFTEAQANAILEMRLQTLAHLETEKIAEELKEKKRLIEELTLLLKSQQKILGVVQSEVADLKKQYGDERRTKVVAGGLKEFREEDLIPDEEAVITFSQGGYIKRLPPGSFRVQNRGGKGLIGSEVGEEDFLVHLASAKTHDNILFFTDRGRVLQSKVYEIPPASRTAKGKPIHNFLEIPLEERVTAIVAIGNDARISAYLAMVTKHGIIKKTRLQDFANVRRTGIIAIGLRKNDLLKWVKLASGGDEIIITTQAGQAIRFRENDLRPLGRTASGVTAIRLRKGDEVASMDIIPKRQETRDKGQGVGQKLLAVMANGFGKQTPLKEYKVQKRGGIGIRTAKITAKTGPLVSAHLVTGEEEVIALSAKGQVIRSKLSDVRIAGRSTQGVKIMTLNAGDKVVGVICL